MKERQIGFSPTVYLKGEIHSDLQRGMAQSSNPIEYEESLKINERKILH